MNWNAAFQWKCQPQAETLILKILDKAMHAHPFIASLSQDLEKHTSTRLFDWLDHVGLSNTPELEKELQETGFASDITTSTYRVFHHPGAQLPRVVVYDEYQAGIDI